MRPYKSLLSLILIIIFLIYINYSKKYNNFILSENSLPKLSNKIYYIKREYIKRHKILDKYKILLNIDNNDYEIICNRLDYNYNNALIRINIEIEKIKNLNKIYYTKIYNLDDINKLYIIESDYKKNLNKILDLGYDKILSIEIENTKLFYLLYNFYSDEIKYQNQTDLNKNCIFDLNNIINNYNDKISIKKIKGILKCKKNKCNIGIKWGEGDFNIKCCDLK